MLKPQCTVERWCRAGHANMLAVPTWIKPSQASRVLPHLKYQQMTPLGGATENPIKLMGMFCAVEVGWNKPSGVELRLEHLIGSKHVNMFSQHSCQSR